MNIVHLLGGREEERKRSVCLQHPAGAACFSCQPSSAGTNHQLVPVMFAQEWEIRSITEVSPAAAGEAGQAEGRGKEVVRAPPAPSTSANPPAPSSHHLSQQLRDQEETRPNPDL